MCRKSNGVAPCDRSLLRHLEPTVGIVFEFPETALAPRVRASIKHRRIRRIRRCSDRMHKVYRVSHGADDCVSR